MEWFQWASQLRLEAHLKPLTPPTHENHGIRLPLGMLNHTFGYITPMLSPIKTSLFQKPNKIWLWFNIWKVQVPNPKFDTHWSEAFKRLIIYFFFFILFFSLLCKHFITRKVKLEKRKITFWYKSVTLIKFVDWRVQGFAPELFISNLDTGALIKGLSSHKIILWSWTMLPTQRKEKENIEPI